MKPVLLVIDVQKAFPPNAPSLQQAIPVINAAIDLFRENKLPIIAIQHINERDGLVPGTEGFELAADLHLLSADPRVHKTYGNAFNKTSLGQLVEEYGADTLILTGYAAENCVLSTCRAALDRDLTPVILRGSIGSRNPANITFVESINDLISFNALKKFLAG
ncbi:Hypothetical protein LUCI_2240 [Lucifera butyrica]|uniref:Isochorismatase-like domain-containing protein n=1 Tax=Lucifera butyrica TaxID=1351585 RepID=A0A498R2Y3_9FIRM|nr:isochorismatase family cysteine hydrolase [Lucifera butyrica]VBB06996.1 Hypothetical protein LUCI_2240 [Lucifera butyrica]